ncbi:hypothetical protein [Pseudalkalibacillus salsuginis]|uniref:hypothetical protein n=1 Tax=Pseudalkalibacillus salsuginis TaxID=2910972 RepID=UPI001F3328DD|nr:hypothetical protein [Pseudalkalibacillus salsuginis]MCF6409352.1 hypothetical protein [Pseudalkalibacillus salsuginis]
MVLIVGCSKEPETEQHFKDLLDGSDITSFSINIGGESTGIITDREKIKEFYQFLKNVNVKRMTSEEVVELHKDEKSIEVMVETDTAYEMYGIPMLQDGQMGVVMFKNGIGKVFYKSVQTTPDLYEDIYTYSKEKLDHGKPVQLNIIEKLEKENENENENDIIEYPADERVPDNGK